MFADAALGYYGAFGGGGKTCNVNGFIANQRWNRIRRQGVYLPAGQCRDKAGETAGAEGRAGRVDGQECIYVYSITSAFLLFFWQGYYYSNFLYGHNNGGYFVQRERADGS